MPQSFPSLGVSAEVEHALAARGIVEPFRIQTLVVPEALAGRDVLGQAPTGSGKTLAFGVPIVERLSADEKAPAALKISLATAKIGMLRCASFTKTPHK